MDKAAKPVKVVKAPKVVPAKVEKIKEKPAKESTVIPATDDEEAGNQSDAGSAADYSDGEPSQSRSSKHLVDESLTAVNPQIASTKRNLSISTKPAGRCVEL